MKREIIFRGKCVSDSKYAGQWVEGGYVPHYENSETKEALIVVFYGGNTTSTCHVIPETVGQYIGVKDKDGKQIFEGDIVDCWSQGRHCTNGIVTWMENRIFITIKGKDGHVVDNWHIMPNNNGIDEGLSVIGNIYDNPDLLKGAAQ